MSVEVTWFGSQPSLQLLSFFQPNIRCVEIKSSDLKSQIRSLNNINDLAFIVDLQTNLRSSLVCKFMKREYGIPSYSCKKGSLDRMLMVAAARFRGRKGNFDSSPTEKSQYMVMADCLRGALEKHLPVEMRDEIKTYVPKPFLGAPEQAREFPWQKELRFGHWLAIAPGAAHVAKQTPVEVHVEILRLVKEQLLASDRRINLVFLGNEKDRKIAVEILEQLQWPWSILNLAGKLTLAESSLAAKEAEVVISNDSSMCHIAEAMGIPVAALFGPTSERFGFPPWRKESRSFSSGLGCRPCSKHGSVSCRYGDSLCFKEIDSEEVSSFLLSLILNLEESKVGAEGE
tara:strand:+ start:275 stop:1306 length:1032 start_codon:yes stop_codon:yes gene_type:complete